MRRKINAVLLALLILTLSCSEDFFDTKSTDTISAADAFSTPENMMLVLNGLHRMMYAQSPLPGGDWNYSGQSFYLPLFDLIGGNVINTAPSGSGWLMSNIISWNSHTYAWASSVRYLWYQRYHFINSTNSIINAVDEEDYTNDKEMSNILGQAHAYRAWAYHQLVMTYCKGYIIGNPETDPGVPLRLSSEAPYDGGPRGTVKEIYDQIEYDINKAISYLLNASPPVNKSHISLNVAYGIKARISLSKGDWSEAAEAAVNARQSYPLMSETEWKSGFNTVDLPEIIWGGHVIEAETNDYASYFYYVSPTFNGFQPRVNPKIINMEVYNQLPATDFRRDCFLPLAPNSYRYASNGQGGSAENDPNYDNETDFWNAWQTIIDTYGMTAFHNTHSYMSVKFLQKNPGTIDPDDVIYMRSAEMYLIEAEALVMLNDITGAQRALSVLGYSRDPAFDETIFTTQSLLMNQIKIQRAVELWGEGFSFHDKIRWNDPLDHTNSGASEILYLEGFYQDRPSVNNAWIWKIPQDEIDNNSYLTEADQNPD